MKSYQLHYAVSREAKEIAVLQKYSVISAAARPYFAAVIPDVHICLDSKLKLGSVVEYQLF